MSARLIPRRSASEPPAPLDFAALRADGMRALRQLCGERWTDHNLHDPGITLLEAYVYALSELAYRSDAPLAELLSDAKGEIDYAGLGLHGAADSLSCRACTAQDLRRWLLDRVPGLHDVGLQVGADRVGGPPLWQLAIEIEADVDEPRLLAAVRAAFLEQRQLGEDLSDRIELLRPQRCSLQAVVEIEGAREPAELLAELLHRAQLHLAGLPGEPIESPAEDLGGPLLRQPQRLLPQARPASTRLADLLACLRAVDGVRELPELALLSLDGAPLQDGRLALQLPGSSAELASLRLQRRGNALRPDPNQVLARLADLQRQQRLQVAAAPAAVAPLPAGRAQDAAAYVSLAEQLPGVYGLGRQDPGQAGPRGYIALFDQLLANAQQQLQQLPDLWSATGDLSRSHWWRLLDTPALVYAEEAERLQQRAFAAFDEADARRHRALDALLALHGQVYAQNTLRQFLAHLEPALQQRLLLDNKAEFARDLLALNRERGAGPNPLQPDAPAAGLARRMPLLLGLRPQPPSLVEALARQGLRGLDKQSHARALPGGSLHRLASAPETAAPTARLAELLPADCRPEGRLPEALLRAAQQAGHWRWAAASGELWLRAEQGELGWCLGEAAELGAAQALAERLQAALAELIAAGEGLQLLDHVLLRPHVGGQRSGLPADLYRLRASLVLPSWSLRGRQRGFRAFADETLRHNAPAHVQARCLWLDGACWQRFEPLHAQWMRALHAQAAQPEEPALAAALDAAADALLRLLAPRLRRCWGRD